MRFWKRGLSLGWVGMICKAVRGLPVLYSASPQPSWCPVAKGRWVTELPSECEHLSLEGTAALQELCMVWLGNYCRSLGWGMRNQVPDGPEPTRWGQQKLEGSKARVAGSWARAVGVPKVSSLHKGDTAMQSTTALGQKPMQFPSPFPLPPSTAGTQSVNGVSLAFPAAGSGRGVTKRQPLTSRLRVL